MGWNYTRIDRTKRPVTRLHFMAIAAGMLPKTVADLLQRLPRPKGQRDNGTEGEMWL